MFLFLHYANNELSEVYLETANFVGASIRKTLLFFYIKKLFVWSVQEAFVE